MSWDRVLLHNSSPHEPLATAIDCLFADQRKRWQLFRDGEAALSSIQTKALTRQGDHVVVQSNPGRRKSTYASVDAKSVAARRCFLCPENMPADERGIARQPLVILPNPYPVLRRHCTIPDRDHRPQRINGRIRLMLDLARQLGPQMLVFYNGPRCGASAPDHFHFQACATDGLPIIRGKRSGDQTTSPRGYESFGRRLLVFCDQHVSAVQHSLEQAVAALRQLTGDVEEPMLNLIALYENEHYSAWLFPRAAHRPSCYAADLSRRLSVSPAALEMAGLLVVAEPDHFDRIDAEAAYQIYTEISLDQERFGQLVELLARS